MAVANMSRDAAPGRVCVRWTVGDVSPAGYEALRLSIHGALRLFGPETRYEVCVNTLTEIEARSRTGPVPEQVRWRRVEADLPAPLRAFLDGGMTEGTAWKLLPVRLDPDAFELALDNDVILWALPPALARWLAEPGAAHRVIAADVRPAHGAFAGLCGPEPRNSGIRALPPGFDYEAEIAAVLAEHPAALTSELDEQGLQVAALSRRGDVLVVGTEEVSICSPFPPHTPGLGRCGAHFVGLNARDIPWAYYDRPAIEVRLEHWRRHRPALYGRVGLALPREEVAGR
jgi:hypothetical protein